MAIDVAFGRATGAPSAPSALAFDKERNVAVEGIMVVEGTVAGTKEIVLIGSVGVTMEHVLKGFGMGVSHSCS